MQLIELGMASRGLETVLAELAAGGIDFIMEAFDGWLLHPCQSRAPSTDHASGL